jgi:hypothetical protein
MIHSVGEYTHELDNISHYNRYGISCANGIMVYNSRTVIFIFFEFFSYFASFSLKKYSNPTVLISLFRIKFSLFSL